MKLTDEIAEKVLWDENYNEEEWEQVGEEEEHLKHATRSLYLHFKHFPSNTFWAVHGTANPGWGMEYHGFFEVEPVEVTTVVYKEKK